MLAPEICESLQIKKCLKELKRELKGPMKLYGKADISIAHNPIQHDRAKHISSKK